MSPDSLARFYLLIESFPRLRDRLPYGDPSFDAIAFARAARPLSSGEKDAVLFILGVWNGETDWLELAELQNRGSGRFDLFSAMANWDDAHRRAFVAWAEKPFFM